MLEVCVYRLCACAIGVPENTVVCVDLSPPRTSWTSGGLLCFARAIGDVGNMCVFLAGHGDVEVPATLAGSVSRSALDCCSLEFRTHAHRHATAQVKESLRMSWQDVMISSCAQAFPPRRLYMVFIQLFLRLSCIHSAYMHVLHDLC